MERALIIGGGIAGPVVAIALKKAFSAYEWLRRERVEAMVVHAKHTGDQLVLGPVGQILRDSFITMMTRKIAAKDRSWIWNYRIDWDERVAV
jgi:FAD-dependent urate hydroxylase